MKVEIKTPVPVERTVTITMTESEAATLANVVGQLYGNSRHTLNLHEELRKAGVNRSLGDGVTYRTLSYGGEQVMFVNRKH